MQIESCSPVFLDMPSETQREEIVIAISLPFVVDSPRLGTPLRGERFEHISVKPDPKDLISQSVLKIILIGLKHVVIGILEGIGIVTIEATYRKLTEKNDINENPKPEKKTAPEKKEEIPEESEWEEPEWI